jgi:cysteinyl-tRNA synthetase
MVTVEGTKMGKSLGNAIYLKELMERHDAMTIRFFVLSSHYRSPTDFGEEALEAATRGLQRLTSTVALVRDRLRDAEGEEVDAEWAAKLEDYRARFEEVMDDDFNAPRGIATLFDLGREVNILLNSDQPASRGTLEAIDDLYQSLGGDVLGLLVDDPVSPRGALQADSDLVDGLVRMLIEMRQEAREARDWARSDAIRDRLSAMGIVLEDGPDGTRWRLSP